MPFWKSDVAKFDVGDEESTRIRPISLLQNFNFKGRKYTTGTFTIENKKDYLKESIFVLLRLWMYSITWTTGSLVTLEILHQIDIHVCPDPANCVWPHVAHAWFIITIIQSWPIIIMWYLGWAPTKKSNLVYIILLLILYILIVVVMVVFQYEDWTFVGYIMYVIHCLYLINEYAKKKGDLNIRKYLLYPLLFPPAFGAFYSYFFSYILEYYPSLYWKALVRLLIHPAVNIVGLIGSRLFVNLLDLPHACRSSALVVMIQVYFSICGRMIISDLGDLATITVTSSIIMLWEILMRISLKYRDYIFRTIYHMGFSNILHYEKYSQLLTDEKANFLMRGHYVILDTAVEVASKLCMIIYVYHTGIITAPVSFMMFGWRQTLTLQDVIIRIAIQLAFRMVTDIINLFVNVYADLPFVEAWKTTDKGYYPMHFYFYVTLTMYTLNSFGARLGLQYPLSHAIIHHY